MDRIREGKRDLQDVLYEVTLNIRDARVAIKGLRAESNEGHEVDRKLDGIVESLEAARSKLKDLVDNLPIDDKYLKRKR